MSQPGESALHRFAVLTAGATLFLIFAGGMVTSTGSALAVPDWPLSYGRFFPPMVGGVFFEHGHRMVAATVGFLMLALAIWIFLREKRRWVGWLAAAALSAVVAQGVLGGITVLFLLPTAVSVAHACLAQAFFCLTITLAVVTGSRWRDMAEAPAAGMTSAGLRRGSILLAVAIYLQLILGAVMRHTGAGLAIPDFPLAFGRIIPPFDSPQIAIHFAHRVWAAVVACIGFALAQAVLRRHRGQRLLTRPAWLLMLLLATQVTLGAVTVWSAKSPIPTSLHVVCGAALLACCLVLALRCHRIGASLMPARRAGRAPMTREATA